MLPGPLTVGSEAGNIAEHLLNNRLQVWASSTNAKIAMRTRQMKIGPGDQVRVNWKTSTLLDRVQAYLLRSDEPLRRESVAVLACSTDS